MKKYFFTFCLICCIIIANNAQTKKGKVIVPDKVYEQFIKDKSGVISDWIPSAEQAKKNEKEYLAKITPEAKNILEQIKKLDENKYYRLLSNSGTGIYLPEFYSSGRTYNFSDPVGFRKDSKQNEYNLEVELLALKFKNASGESKEKFKSEMREKLSQLFEMREKDRKEEIVELEKRISELKKAIEERKKAKEIIMNKRLAEILGERIDIEW